MDFKLREVGPEGKGGVGGAKWWESPGPTAGRQEIIRTEVPRAKIRDSNRRLRSCSKTSYSRFLEKR